MSQEQAASLLAHAFFCTFPSSSDDLPSVNFGYLFSMKTSTSMEKLRCVFHYFHTISKKMPTGLLTFRRQKDSMPDWSSLQMLLSNLCVTSSGRIEDNGYGMLQVDFANSYIGGGVLGNGCVQEEIRFLICPELMVSMLLCEKMDDNEAIVICGAQRFSSYTGYGPTFRWQRMEHEDSTPRDRFGRLLCELVAIDALPFLHKDMQFHVELVDRELLKAYVGFAALKNETRGVATGLIQLMAASARNRPLCYCTFGNGQFADSLQAVYTLLKQHNATVGMF
ncbi:unnamed protein product [Gongylonema pulchrum]|uniref:poly(ADP-ribose) glycohydrolase n=1 Tax=Gongylonema pulchrum TaxID=637853 RepID=A0A183CUL5_9BILA|nr:unnamed protein product [Gongylonema pulchrum]